MGWNGNILWIGGKWFDVEYSGDITQGFKVTNKKPLDPPTPTQTPNTSDDTHVKTYGLLMLLSAVLVVIVAAKRMKYSNY